MELNHWPNAPTEVSAAVFRVPKGILFFHDRSRAPPRYRAGGYDIRQRPIRHFLSCRTRAQCDRKQRLATVSGDVSADVNAAAVTGVSFICRYWKQLSISSAKPRCDLLSPRERGPG